MTAHRLRSVTASLLMRAIVLRSETFVIRRQTTFSNKLCDFDI